MPPSEGNGGPYEVHCSGAIVQKLRDIQRQATEEGRGEAVLAAIRHILQRLQQDPKEFGEPLYRLSALRMQICHGGVGPLFIDFAVCEDHPLVFIKGATLLGKPGSQ
jgi:hypothetical protein